MPRQLSVAVCTIEKASMIAQSMMEHGRLGEIVAVVCDEFHLIGEGRRGAILERTIARLLLFARRAGALHAPQSADGEPTTQGCSGRLPQSSIDSSSTTTAGRRQDGVRGAQIICMSATIPNPGQLQAWLEPCARFEATGQREVPLHEHIYTTAAFAAEQGNRILNTDGSESAEESPARVFAARI